MTLIERNDIIKTVAASLGLRTYQRECVEGIATCFLENYSKDYLISACCRYGKTTTALGACKAMMALTYSTDMVVCVISGLPGSVKSSWRDDAYRLGLIKNNETAELEVENTNFTQTNGIHVTFISTQKLGDNEDKDGNIKEHVFVEDYKNFFNNHSGLKIIIFDEAHNASSSERILTALAGFNYDYKLELTATPYTQELYNKYKLDTVNADKNSYFFSQQDMLKLYESSEEITLANGMKAKEGFTYTVKNDKGEVVDTLPWKPVKPVVEVEDLYSKLQEEGFEFIALDESKETAFVSAYFKTIFAVSNKENYASYEKYRRQFVETYIIEKSESVGKNFLAFVTSNAVASQVAWYINKHYGNKVTAKSLADEKLEEDEDTFSDKANKIFSKDDGKIHFVITCRKCGTGSSMPLLNCTMFMKGCVSFTEWQQFASRAYNPADGKEYGYTIMFSTTDALQMLAQHANTEKHDLSQEPNARNIQDYLQYIKVFLDGTELVDATELIEKLDSVYSPRQTILFPSLDLMSDDIFAEIAEKLIGRAKTGERKTTDPKDKKGHDKDDDQGNNGIGGGGSREPGEKKEGKLSPEMLKKLFQETFVAVVREFAEDDMTEEDIAAIDENSPRRDQKLITVELCSMKLWNIIKRDYFEKILHKVYVYAVKTINK